jgi:hypothetical protein
MRKKAAGQPPSHGKFECRKIGVAGGGCRGVQCKGTVSPDYRCLEVISVKSPWLGHVNPDIKLIKLSLNFLRAFKVLKHIVPDHDGRRPMEVNACIFITHMVYL